MKYFLITLILLASVTFASQAQSSKKKKKQNKRTEQAEKDNSYAPFSPAESAVNTSRTSKAEKSKKRKKKYSYSEIFNRRMDQKVIEFQKRMKQNAKEDRKEARLMKKPQYSDPLYFGHKRKPKKRPPGKRKFCKECGIVH